MRTKAQTRQPLPHIAIAGPIGVGKSTLTRALAKTLGLPAHVECERGGDIFLDRFMAQPERWAFHSQQAFVTEAIEQHQACAIAGGVHERPVAERIGVMSAGQHAHGFLSDEEFDLLKRQAAAGTSAFPPPDLVVCLDASTPSLQQRIAGRGDAPIPEDYLESLGARYPAWRAALEVPTLVVDTEAHDLREPKALKALAARVVDLAS